jgi:putative flippase GtrA
MAPRIARARIVEIWRYYQAGIVNTAFGLAIYSLFVWLGMNIFLAQLLAQVIGVAFNYFTYSSHVFRAAGPAKLRFVLSYVVGYFIALGTLALVARFVQSPYLAGAISALIVSVINYFVLKNLVFRTRAA